MAVAGSASGWPGCRLPPLRKSVRKAGLHIKGARGIARLELTGGGEEKPPALPGALVAEPAGWGGMAGHSETACKKPRKAAFLRPKEHATRGLR